MRKSLVRFVDNGFTVVTKQTRTGIQEELPGNKRMRENLKLTDVGL